MAYFISDEGKSRITEVVLISIIARHFVLNSLFGKISMLTVHGIE